MVQNEVNIIKTLSVAFTRMFPDLADKVESDEVKKWLANSLIKIVEYTGTLPSETKRQRNQRMECHTAYDGDIKTLANLLRNTYPESRQLSPQELILKVYNGITSVYDVLGEEVVKDNPTVDDDANEGTTNASIDSNKGTESKDSDASVSSEVADASSTSVGIAGSSEVEPAIVEEQQNEPANGNKTAETVKEEEIATSDTDNGTKDVQPQHNETEQTNSIPQEEIKMANQNVEDLLSQATAAMATGGEASAAVTPKSNTKSAVDDQAAKIAIADMLQNDVEPRNQWTRQNTVEAVIATKLPAALRATATVGTIATATKTKTAAQIIEEKIANMIKKVSGQEISRAQFEALPDEQKWAMCALADANTKDQEGASNVSKAKAVYALLTEALQNPEGTYDAIVDKNKVTYSQKGVIIGGKPISKDNLIILLLDKSNGAVYAQGSLDANGSTNGNENVTSWQLSKVTDSAKNKTATPSVKKADGKKFSVSVKNRDKFVKDPSHVVYLFTEQDDKASATASFRAKIDVAGVTYPASFQYADKSATYQNKEGKTVNKKKTFSVNVRVAVTDVKKKLDARFVIEGYSATKLDAYWGISIAPKTQTDLANAKGIEGTPLQKVLIGFYQGDISASAAKDSEVLKQLAAIRTQAEAAEDAEQASQLDQ